MVKKELCHCGKEAVWVYAPNGSWFYCDDCISNKDDIGCSCNWENINENRLYSEGKDMSDHLPTGVEGINWRWVEQPESHGVKVTKEDGYWITLDNRQRPYPCCEYDYSENGFYTEEYTKFLEAECIRIGYDITRQPEVKRYIKEYGRILWMDDLIKRVEKIIGEK